MANKKRSTTRESIESAMIFLMGEKRVEDITITELTEKAGVSRAAFYRNYKSKDDVLQSFLDYILPYVEERAWQQTSLSRSFEGYWLGVFKAWAEISTQFNHIDNPLLFNAIQVAINRRSDAYATGAKINRYRDYLLFGAMNNVVREWLNSGMQESPEVMAKFCYTYMPFGK